ncbi:MAG: NADH-quinone oxidoreductase subunit NuoE [Aurantimonas endophytica]|uniref:NADH-quinone oxidoreductase subunit NuoE n=1 Tax=Aurantimonas endophytica TaxID=1522175 RepID=UPI00300342CC
MSVRRLAEDTVQPAGFAFSEANARWAEATLRKYPEGRQQSAVIPLLMRAQDQDGWVTKAAIEYVADMLGMPLIRVLEVATFYTQFQLKPVGTRAHIQVCGTTPCMLRGANDLKDVCRSKIHPEPFHTNADGTLSWEEVECLGACVNAPMVMVFHDTYEDLTPERLEEIIDLFEAGRGAEVAPGPQNGRHLSAPLGGLTSLTGDYDDLIADGATAGAGGSEAITRGPASGAAPQGSGAGSAVTEDDSKAGRPDSYAEETDPSISAPGKADAANDSQAVEQDVTDELVDEAGRPGSGQEGGTVDARPSDQAGRDAAEADQVSGDTPAADAPKGGNLRAQEAEAEDATIAGKYRSEKASPSRDRGRGEPGMVDGVPLDPSEIEGDRTDTSDTSPGPVAKDHFASRGEGGDAAKEAGERPADLLPEPRGDKDDLKRIKGIGPVIENKLNALGVFHYWQISEWREAELVWVDNYLNFRGRVLRDRWIDQARALQGDVAGRA